jgi:hypothetical protein
VLVLGGERDPFVPRGRYDQLVATLNASGADVSVLDEDGSEMRKPPAELLDLAERVRRPVCGRPGRCTICPFGRPALKL